MTATIPRVQLTTRCGRELATDSGRWFAPPDVDDLVALDGLDSPVLDIGCGPGRIVAHLASSGVAALGVDVSEAALDHARDLGAPVLHRSVFDPIPGIGRWGAAVLLDGNIGIGGDPVALLSRARELLRPGGLVVTEVEAPGMPSRCVDARLAVDGIPTPWFPWAVVGADDAADIASQSGLRPLSMRRSGARWFASSQRP